MIALQLMAEYENIKQIVNPKPSLFSIKKKFKMLLYFEQNTMTIKSQI